ncbi:MAG: hypothetical protein LQ347_002957 [Umbilicaria vellea]|nr:MAG: hypothetical protein LQ347_002957 [Umbilicaria vellea]
MSTPNGSGHRSPPTTLAVLGCGTLGTAILCGVLASIEAKNALKAQQHGATPKTNGVHPSSNKSSALGIPSRFIACVRTQASASRLGGELSEFSIPVTISHDGNNADAIHAADIVLLGCQPQDLSTCLGEPAIIDALQGKLLISILAGVTIAQIEALLHLPNNLHRGSTTVVRAMPNTASFVRASATVITTPQGTPASMLRVVDWLFSSVGTVTHIPASSFDICTTLCASTPAFFALFLEALVDGAVALGLKRHDAQIMAAGAMKGAAELVLSGEHPAVVREKVATPGGSTMRGLLRLEEGKLRAVVAGAFIECKIAAEGLGAPERK